MTISVAPVRAAITLTQPLALTATTNDSAGVSWSIAPNGGTFSAATSQNAAPVSFTPAATAMPGTYTITATSVTDKTKAASTTVYLTDLAGVYTYHDDLARDGADTHEYALTPQTVTAASFGKLFSCTADGAIYAQPLWASGVTIATPGGAAKHNVVFVATAHDGLFAFDADATPCQTLWSVSLIDASHGGTAGETPVPAGSKYTTPPQPNLVGYGNGDMAPEVGVTGTPVIDPATGTLYVVSKSVGPDQMTFYQRLHAIDIATGQDKTGSPVVISATYPGAGDGGTADTFDPRTENQRAGLALVNGTVYVAWASHEDFGHYFGWIIGYDGATLKQTYVLNVAPNHANDPMSSPNGHGAGIWMSGGAPAADASGNLYLITGNGPFDASSATAPNDDYGDSLLKLAAAAGKLSVADYFTPADQAQDDSGDNDFGAGGATILADLPSGSPVPHLVVGGEENGNLYVLNRDKLGGYTGGNTGAVQQILSGTELTGGFNNGVIFSTGAYWNGIFYIIANGQQPQLQAYQLSPSTAQLTETSKTAGFGFPSGTPSVSAQGASNGIVWALDETRYCTYESAACGPAVLHAYDATNLGTELWNSAQVAADAAGYPVKFTVPTVANGKVYVGTRGNNIGGPYGSTSINGELDVYGLKAQ